jgi:NAD(P)-dependent dehydrogenase (short-subunit alcohol dehydrogenase family)
VVTGAASGLGLELSRLLIAAGVAAIGVDRADPPGDLIAHRSYVHVSGDVADEATWRAVVARIKEADAGSIDKLGLATSAAVLEVGSILETSRESLMRLLEINVVGTALAMKAILPLMIARGGGSIVAVASVNATIAEQSLAGYNATKAAVRQLARTVAMDHARDGIRINVLSPGPMMAGLFKRHLETAPDAERFLAMRTARQPGGRILDASDVAWVAMFLLSTGSAAMLGADVTVDGGLTASFDFRT